MTNTTQTTQKPTADQNEIKLPIPVTVVLMHKNSHLDEYFAYVLLCMYGGNLFPGISKANIRFIEADVRGTEAEFDASGILPIGCCRGRFDEHLGMNGEQERIPGECATTLVAKYLGDSIRPELYGLIDDVLYFDTHSGCRATQMAEIIKVMHRYNLKNDEYAVLHWARQAIEAVINQERFHFAAVPKEKTLLESFQAIVAGGHFDGDKRALNDITRRVNDSMQRKGECPTQMTYVLEAMFRMPYSAEVIENWLDVALMAMYSDQVDFWQQVDLLKDRPFVEVRTRIGDREKSLNLMMVCNSDSLNSSKAARFIGAAIVLVRNTSGNVQIFVKNSVEGLNLANAVRMIRFMELPQEMKANCDWRGLGCEGKHPGVGNWHYFKCGEMLFNGSDTHAMPATEISTQALIDIIKYAFHPFYLRRWCNERGIIMNPMNPVAANKREIVVKATEALFVQAS